MYSIGDVAEIMGVNTSTIRFYDKQGLLPFVERDRAGRRKFKAGDLNFIKVIDCLKKSGVPVKDIAHFIQMCMAGDGTLRDRYDYLDKQEQVLETKIADMQAQLDFLRYKKWYYKTSVEAGTETIHFLPDSKTVDPQTEAIYKAKLQHCTDVDKLISLAQDEDEAKQ